MIINIIIKKQTMEKHFKEVIFDIDDEPNYKKGISIITISLRSYNYNGGEVNDPDMLTVNSNPNNNNMNQQQEQKNESGEQLPDGRTSTVISSNNINKQRTLEEIDINENIGEGEGPSNDMDNNIDIEIQSIPNNEDEPPPMAFNMNFLVMDLNEAVKD